MRRIVREWRRGLPVKCLQQRQTPDGTDYNGAMAPSAKSAKPAGTTRRYVIGRAQFAAISAVEGLKLSAAGAQRLRKTEGCSAEERRGAIVAAYRKARER